MVANVGRQLSCKGGTSRLILIPIRSEERKGSAKLGTSSATGPSNNSNVGGACYDPFRDCYWRIVAESNGWMYRFDKATGLWDNPIGGAQHNLNGGYLSLTRLPNHDCLLIGTTGFGWRVFDCATRTFHTPTVTGTGALFGFGGEAQPHWIDELGGCVAWDNSTNTTAITLITPGANPRTSLVLSTLPVAGGNAVTPPARRANGTYGRLFPWRSKRILVLINGNGASDAFYYRYGAL